MELAVATGRTGETTPTPPVLPGGITTGEGVIGGLDWGVGAGFTVGPTGLRTGPPAGRMTLFDPAAALGVAPVGGVGLGRGRLAIAFGITIRVEYPNHQYNIARYIVRNS